MRTVDSISRNDCYGSNENSKTVWWLLSDSSARVLSHQPFHRFKCFTCSKFDYLLSTDYENVLRRTSMSFRHYCCKLNCVSCTIYTVKIAASVCSIEPVSCPSLHTCRIFEVTFFVKTQHFNENEKKCIHNPRIGCSCNVFISINRRLDSSWIVKTRTEKSLLDAGESTRGGIILK